MRNNNIIVVKCFISSFTGERIHQGVQGRVGGIGNPVPGAPGAGSRGSTAPSTGQHRSHQGGPLGLCTGDSWRRIKVITGLWD